MFGLGKALFSALILLFSGVIAVNLTIPLLDYMFGVKLIIVGSSAIAGMYLYLVSSMVASLLLLVGIGVIVVVIGGSIWLVLDILQKRQRAARVLAMEERRADRIAQEDANRQRYAT